MHINSQRRISYALHPTLGSTSSGWLAGIFRLPVLHGWCAFNMCEIWDVAQVGQPSGGQWTPLPGWPGGLHATVCFLGMKQNKNQPYWVLNELYTDGKKNCRVSAGFWVQQFQSRTLVLRVPAEQPWLQRRRRLSRVSACWATATWTCLSVKEMEVTPCA